MVVLLYPKHLQARYAVGLVPPHAIANNKLREYGLNSLKVKKE
jgi:hypothetical protein